MSLFARLAAPDSIGEPTASIFLCMHPKDHGRLRHELTEDLWAAAHVFVFYPLDPDAPRDKRYFAVLSQMRAFILPITKRLFKEGSEAVEKELRFAGEHRIPVIPVIMDIRVSEQGIADEYLTLNKSDGLSRLVYEYGLRALLSHLCKEPICPKDAWAYLGGRGVKRAPLRGEALMRRASRSDAASAEALALMHRMGDGVLPSNETALLYQARAVALREKEDDGAALALSCVEYGRLARVMEKADTAREAFLRALDETEALPQSELTARARYRAYVGLSSLAEDREEREALLREAMKLLPALALSDRCLAAEELGMLFLNMGYLSQAETCFSVLEELFRHREDFHSRRILTGIYMQTAALYEVYSKEDEAERYYRMAYEGSRSLKESGRDAALKEHLHATLAYADFARYRKDTVTAEKCYKCAKELAFTLLRIAPCAEVLESYVTALYQLGALEEEKGLLTSAKAYYRTAKEKARELIEQAPSHNGKRMLLCAAVRLCGVYRAEHDDQSLGEEYESLAPLIRQLTHEEPYVLTLRYALRYALDMAWYAKEGRKESDVMRYLRDAVGYATTAWERGGCARDGEKLAALYEELSGMDASHAEQYRQSAISLYRALLAENGANPVYKERIEALSKRTEP